MYSSKIWLALAFLIVVGCDRPGVVEVENRLGDEIKFYYSMSTEYQTSSSRIINLPPGQSDRIYYGFGTKWTESFIKFHTENMIDTVFIEVGSQKYYCSTINCKKALFNESNRKSSRRIEIKIDSNLVEEVFQLRP